MNIQLPTDASFEGKNRNRITSEQEIQVRVKDIVHTYLVVANSDSERSTSR